MAVYYDNETMTPQGFCGVIANFLQEHPRAWVRHQFAVRNDGRQCEPRSPFAVAWCALGLLQKFIRDRDMQDRCEKLLSRAITPYGAAVMRSPASYNDNEAASVEDVIAMFRAASYLPEVRQTPVVRQEQEPANADKMVAEAEAAFFASLAKIEIPDWLKLASPAAPAANDAPPAPAAREERLEAA